MNTQSTSLPEPKSIELSNGGRAILLPNLDLGIYTHGNPKGIFLEAEDFRKIAGKVWFEFIPAGEPPKPLQFPELPENEQWSNPDNLTPEQFGEGHRPLLKSEYTNPPLDAEVYFCKIWTSRSWKPGSECEETKTYRTKAPLPTPKAKEEPGLKVDADTQVFSIRNKDLLIPKDFVSLIENRFLAKFLKGSKVVVMANPMEEWEPYKEVPDIVLEKGHFLRGVGEINDNLEWDAYNGDTFVIRPEAIKTIIR